ncbi:maleylacetate reductase [Streptosporangium amethystogenes subsp. fukuiense]|uniref:Maleylacetate reductase n=1 Tax=Streptosporangium amethystogenes subsp. fukuiense TaxID=698418 RepID=A0ABW2SYW5_9ACTN
MADHKLAFTHETLGQRVILDAGGARRHLAEEVERLGASRVMLIAGDGEARIADEVSAGLPVSLRWREVVQHVPVEVAERARSAAAEAGADLLVSVGGGSTTGLAKAVAMTTHLPIVAVPTTYAGSEATRMWGLTENREKTTGLDPAVLPVTVIYDSVLTLSLPVALSVASGFNGLAHCVDSMWAPGTDPINQALALEGIRALTTGLPKVVAEPEGIDGRDRCLYGAYLSAVSFASAGSGLHHKICHVLGGAYDLPHAQTHAIVLPHVLAYNAPAVPDAARRIARAFGARPGQKDDPAEAAVTALERLRGEVDAPRALKDVGMAEFDIPGAAARVMKVVPPSNPAPVSRESVEILLRAAWAGRTPGSRS